MYHRTDLIYLYDGTFDGFLCCVFDAVTHRRFPVQVFREEDDEIPALLPLHHVATDAAQAARVRRSIPQKISPEALVLLKRAFLTCLPQKEVYMLRFVLKGYHAGGKLLHDLGDNDVHRLQGAVYHMEHEAHLLTGFVRFSDVGGALVAEIEPKNQVLPLVAGHFASRFSGERFMIFDRVHHCALLHDEAGLRLVTIQALQLPPPGREERQYRALWKQFFDTIAIEARRNPRCQRTLMPLRYRSVMTEHQAFDAKTMWEAARTTDIPREEKQICEQKNFPPPLRITCGEEQS